MEVKSIWTHAKDTVPRLGKEGYVVIAENEYVGVACKLKSSPVLLLKILSELLIDLDCA